VYFRGGGANSLIINVNKSDKSDKTKNLLYTYIINYYILNRYIFSFYENREKVLSLLSLLCFSSVYGGFERFVKKNSA
jgi:hypothetical protein